MKIFIDGDGCPVIDNTIKIGQSYNLKVIVVKNQAHKIKSSYAQVITVDISRDSADFLIFNKIGPGDILITQDLGLAALVLGKNSFCLNQNGQIIDTNNIDFLLENRHLSSKLRREQNIYSKIKKREPQMDSHFENSLIQLIEDNLN